MATFYVGQRVRVNCPDSGMHGHETRIVALNRYSTSFGCPYIGHEVCDTLGDDPDFEEGLPVFEPHELEPIIPEGHKPVEWSADSPWLPEHLREKAT